MKFGDLKVNWKGKITGGFKTMINGKEISIPVNTSIQKLKEIENNKINPDSRDKEIVDKNELIISMNDFQVNSFAGTELGKKLFRSYLNALSNGFNNIVLKKTDYKEFLRLKAIKEDEDYRLNNTARLNNEGIALEKAGEIDQAISVYESNIKTGYPSTHSYERLMILYHIKKDQGNEIRVINYAIEVFTKANEERADKAIQSNPHCAAKIQKALFFCEKVMGNDGFYCFVPYDVLKYKKRLFKLICK
jgi:hypothetical protein